MDTEDLTAEEKCENIMNIVVESRKRFGTLCRDYESKSHLMQNNLLNLQLETISNYNFKPKNPVTCGLKDNSSDIEAFIREVTESKKQFENIKTKLKNLTEVVSQINNDEINKRSKQPLNDQVLLERAKKKL